MTTQLDQSELNALASEPATRWAQLEAELQMLCRSLCRTSGWTPEAVTTFICLPDDAEYRQAIGALCRRLAAECGMEQTVRHDGGDWCVRFARPASTGSAACQATAAKRGLRAAFGRAYAAWRLSVAHRQGRGVVM